jgi:hypothetical protein
VRAAAALTGDRHPVEAEVVEQFDRSSATEARPRPGIRVEAP